LDLVRSRVEQGQADSKIDTSPATPIRDDQTTTERGVTTADNAAPSLAADPAATTVLQKAPSSSPLTSPAADRSVDQKIFNEPAPVSVSAEEAAREAAILEVVRSPAALPLGGQREESVAQEPEQSSPLGWRYGAALSLFTVGVLALQQSKSDPAARRRLRLDRECGIGSPDARLFQQGDTSRTSKGGWGPPICRCREHDPLRS